MKINFDMDGTFVNLYGVEGWLDYLLESDVTPYRVAKPLVNMSQFARLLNKLQSQGYEIGVISWTAKCGSQAYNNEVARVKRAWLKQHCPSVKFDSIQIVPYGTCKATLSTGILFDDEEQNRFEWGEGAYDVNDMIEILKNISNMN